MDDKALTPHAWTVVEEVVGGGGVGGQQICVRKFSTLKYVIILITKSI
jgi:hypothetical protein